MSLTDDSDALETNIKAKLSSHVKKRIKQTGGTKRKSEPSLEDPDTEDGTGSNKKCPTKGKKHVKPQDDDQDSDKGELETQSPPQKISTLDVLQLLLNDRKRALMRDKDVIEFIRMKQSRFPHFK